MPPKAKAPAAGGPSLDLCIGASPKAKASMPSPLGRAGASMLGPTPKAAAASPRSAGNSKGSIGGTPRDPVPGVSKMDSSSSMGKSGSRVMSARSGTASRGEPGGRMTEGGSARGERPRENGSTVSKISAAEGPAEASTGGAGGAASGGAVDSAQILKFHSAVRWCKPWAEIEASLGEFPLATAVRWQDPKNGNTALHIASQNGHLDIVKKLCDAGTNINAQNGKGQTALHMSVEYDFYFVSKALVDKGADINVTNEDGSRAITGIEGSKTGENAWDNAVTILKCANTKDELDFAFQELEKGLATPELISKSELIQTGMAKKKSPVCKDVWDHKRFMTLAAKF